MVTPKVFISYSWTSPDHQKTIADWADRLLGDGIDVTFDLFDLKEGQDTYHFMERMVADQSLTHVLVFSDRKYAEKADDRTAGVGVESQIISKEVYDKINQSKFIPIVCEADQFGKPYLPTFLKSRKWIDFSSPEAANENWEQLIRLLYGKPLHEKPVLGNAPAYIRESSTIPSSPALAKFVALRHAILQGKTGLSIYRKDFLDACIDFAAQLRDRERPEIHTLGEKVLDDCGKLKHVRDHIVDWVLMEAENRSGPDFSETLFVMLERILLLKSPPPKVSTWHDAWLEAHRVFVYETFLYCVAALIKGGSFAILHELFSSNYLLPENDYHGGSDRFGGFDVFYGSSEALQQVLAPPNQRLSSPTAELIKRQAGRADLTFNDVIEAELLVLLMTFLSEDSFWYPQTLHYVGRHNEFTFFLRASQHKHFAKLAIITGINSAESLREAIKKGQARMKVEQWHTFRFNGNFERWMNLDKLNSLK